MPLTDTAKAVALDAVCKGTAPTLSLTHVGLRNSGTELSGGSPAYARKPVTFNAAAAGESAIPSDLTFDIPAGATVNEVAYYSALTAGTLLGTDPVTAETYAAQGQYTVKAGSKISLTDV